MLLEYLSETRTMQPRPKTSFMIVPETVASADYGREIAAAVRSGNRLGAQFHPERSGEAGARFLKAFLDS